MTSKNYNSYLYWSREREFLGGDVFDSTSTYTISYTTIKEKPLIKLLDFFIIILNKIKKRIQN